MYKQFIADKICSVFKCEQTFLNSNRHLHPETPRDLYIKNCKFSEILRRRKILPNAIESSFCVNFLYLSPFENFGKKISREKTSSIAKARIIRLKEPEVLSVHIIVAKY